MKAKRTAFEPRMLRGYLRSRRAIEKFLAGDSGREFAVRVVADDMSDSRERLRPFESADSDWRCDELGYVTGRGVSADAMDAARKRAGGVLVLVSFD